MQLPPPRALVPTAGCADAHQKHAPHRRANKGVVHRHLWGLDRHVRHWVKHREQIREHDHGGYANKTDGADYKEPIGISPGRLRRLSRSIRCPDMSDMTLRVTTVEPLDDHNPRLTFSDGLVRDFDASPLMRGSRPVRRDGEDAEVAALPNSRSATRVGQAFW
jgi:hypothetical protein